MIRMRGGGPPVADVERAEKDLAARIKTYNDTNKELEAATKAKEAAVGSAAAAAAAAAEQDASRKKLDAESEVHDAQTRLTTLIYSEQVIKERQVAIAKAEVKQASDAAFAAEQGLQDAAAALEHAQHTGTQADIDQAEQDHIAAIHLESLLTAEKETKMENLKAAEKAAEKEAVYAKVLARASPSNLGKILYPGAEQARAPSELDKKLKEREKQRRAKEETKKRADRQQQAEKELAIREKEAAEEFRKRGKAIGEEAAKRARVLARANARAKGRDLYPGAEQARAAAKAARKEDGSVTVEQQRHNAISKLQDLMEELRITSLHTHGEDIEKHKHSPMLHDGFLQKNKKNV